MTTPLLCVRGVKTFYGRVMALKGVDIDVNDGEIVTLIGANGAGKSTLMMTICGNPRAREGTIEFAGRDITQMPTHEIARLNLAQAPEGRRIFSRMTVLENLQMGATTAEPSAFEHDLERVLTLFPRLKQRLNQRGGTLSGGEQQMLALAPLIVRQIFDAIKTLNAQDRLTVFLVEQNAFHALKLAHRGYVMVNGLITLSGTGRELLERAEIKSAYLEGGRQKAGA
jgi:branched-chain amino acid transport system ATP-binding protein